MLDTGYACALIVVKDDMVIDSAPIFWKLRGKKAEPILSKYKHYKLKVK